MATDTIAIQANRPTATQVVWASDPPVPVLITNTSLTGTVFVSEDNTARVSDNSGLVPIGPNGSIVVDGTRNFYAVTASATPITINTISGGMAIFLGITQGLGSLVLSSIFSPNFVHNVSGWSINKDGSAEFNNLTIRGTFNGTNFIINSNGIFLYNGTPALGNLFIAISNNIGPDQFGNNYTVGINIFSTSGAGGQIVLANNAGQPDIFLIPAGMAHLTVDGQIFPTSGNTGLVNEQAWLIFTSGKENAHEDSAIQLISQSADATLPALYVWEHGGNVGMKIDPTIGLLLAGQSAPASNPIGYAGIWCDTTGSLRTIDSADGQTYSVQHGHQVLNNSSGAITSIAPATTAVALSRTVSARQYIVRGVLYLTCNATGFNPEFEITSPGGGTPGIISWSGQRGTVLLGTTEFQPNVLAGVGAAASYVSGNVYIFYVYGVINPLSSGTSQLLVAVNASGGSFTVDANSTLTWEPV